MHTNTTAFVNSIYLFVNIKWLDNFETGKASITEDTTRWRLVNTTDGLTREGSILCHNIFQVTALAESVRKLWADERKQRRIRWQSFQLQLLFLHSLTTKPISFSRREFPLFVRLSHEINAHTLTYYVNRFYNEWSLLFRNYVSVLVGLLCSLLEYDFSRKETSQSQ